MRFLFSHRTNFVMVPLLALAIGFVPGCGGDSGGDPEPTPECSISAVNTGLVSSWLSGEEMRIRWTAVGGPGTVVIELLKGGAVVSTIAASTANDGFFSWAAASTGGQANGSDFGVRVTATGDVDCTSEVNDLTITDVAGCNITFTATVDSITAGETFDITWTGNNTSGTVDIELWTSTFGQGLDQQVGTVVFGAADTGTYSWAVDSFNNGTYGFYRYVIRDPLVAGCEAVSPQFAMIDEENCSIGVFGPATQPLWNNGDQMLITFTSENSSGQVDLRLYAGNLWVPGGVIADNVPAAGEFPWTVSDFGFTASSTSYNIRAIDSVDGYCTGESDRFTITP